MAVYPYFWRVTVGTTHCCSKDASFPTRVRSHPRPLGYPNEGIVPEKNRPYANHKSLRLFFLVFHCLTLDRGGCRRRREVGKTNSYSFPSKLVQLCASFGVASSVSICSCARHCHHNSNKVYMVVTASWYFRWWRLIILVFPDVLTQQPTLMLRMVHLVYTYIGSP